MERASEPGNLRDYLRPLWLRKWLILVLVVGATAAAYVFEARKPDQFEAFTQVYAQPPTVAALVGAESQAGSDRSTQNLATRARSLRVAGLAADHLGRDDPQAILDSVEINPASGTDFILILARAGTGQEAADIANAFARAYVRRSGQQFRREIDETIESARDQLEALGTDEFAEVERRGLRSDIRQLSVIRAQPNVGGQTQDPATAPAQRAAPKPVRSALFAFALSLILAVAIAFGLARLDRRIKSVEEVSPAYGRPLLAALPHTSELTTRIDGAAVLSPPLREAFRSLRTNLQLAALDRPIRKLLITSALPGEGKSTVVRNLAVAYREWGLKVVVVESDLRKPSLSELFDVPADAGFTEVLTGQRELSDTLQPVAVDMQGLETLAQVRATSTVNGNGHAPVDTGSLAVLTSGAQPPNPGAVLAAQRTHALLDELAGLYDVVIIDSAPLLAVSDAVSLLREVDGIVLIARVGATTTDAARRISELIDRVPDTHVLGVVANDFRAIERSPAYGYGSSYGYDYEKTR